MRIKPDPLEAVQELETPCLLLDRDIVAENIRRAAAKAGKWGLSLRPHVKTHKCVEVARLQMDAAAGFTAAKTDEALVFLKAGFSSILLAYPLVSPRKIDRLLREEKNTGGRIRFMADSPETLLLLSQAAKRHGRRLEVMLKIDVGLGRCGLKPDDPRIFDLAGSVAKDQGLVLKGVMSHAGHAYAARNRAEAATMAEDERKAMTGLAARLKERGGGGLEISVGATPTLLAAGDFSGLSELRPGNYVFLDLCSVRMGLAGLDRIGLVVLSSVVSLNQEHAILDAGSKTLSTDLGPHSTGRGAGFGLAWPFERGRPAGIEDCAPVARLSEEHGFVRLADLRRKPKIGQKFGIFPNHACSTANLAERYAVLPGAGSKSGGVEFWEVQARAKVL